MQKNAQESTNALLRVIVALLLRRKEDQTLNLRQQIEILHDLGIKPAEIAEILGRTGTYINKELSGIRKGRKRPE
jgi:prolipoprotein diacylglyceryltransferase